MSNFLRPLWRVSASAWHCRGRGSNPWGKTAIRLYSAPQRDTVVRQWVPSLLGVFACLAGIYWISPNGVTLGRGASVSPGSKADVLNSMESQQQSTDTFDPILQMDQFGTEKPFLDVEEVVVPGDVSIISAHISREPVPGKQFRGEKQSMGTSDGASRDNPVSLKAEIPIVDLEHALPKLQQEAKEEMPIEIEMNELPLKEDSSAVTGNEDSSVLALKDDENAQRSGDLQGKSGSVQPSIRVIYDGEKILPENSPPHGRSELAGEIAAPGLPHDVDTLPHEFVLGDLVIIEPGMSSEPPVKETMSESSGSCKVPASTNDIPFETNTDENIDMADTHPFNSSSTTPIDSASGSTETTMDRSQGTTPLSAEDVGTPFENHVQNEFDIVSKRENENVVVDAEQHSLGSEKQQVPKSIDKKLLAGENIKPKVDDTIVRKIEPSNSQAIPEIVLQTNFITNPESDHLSIGSTATEILTLPSKEVSETETVASESERPVYDCKTIQTPEIDSTMGTTPSRLEDDGSATITETAEAKTETVSPILEEPTAESLAPSVKPALEDKGMAYNPDTGEINWDCPCLGGLAYGPCGEEFRLAFSCFVYSDKGTKTAECLDKFHVMQNCFQAHPDYYFDDQNVKVRDI
ncbi:Mia40p KNAG_0E03830 [Huiozyma naganishii CBS 8797]|uniref:Mitochondrial intermembrane space import and assembly protein 40 n=1 Tax=Huiozyma naganishii (strain ATCC MYA-139 / BCRC 22969 / CBS 8797 / KCTC 17520 / NBRC 10181 / NCYC 3082 / Yp74L-3) TaxID=1071383 RepID=J7RZJ4_HUIN7|nr:hypothetical protein KNAG_0E03830 [Kazachstania naganishii CBS 8797]CCK70637.1 hypothetical protein KNAG_0E03830 [Kazachstania naganishii CBS 8797]